MPPASDLDDEPARASSPSIRPVSQKRPSDLALTAGELVAWRRYLRGAGSEGHAAPAVGTYHHVLVHRIDGELDARVLSSALDRVVARHEALRLQLDLEARVQRVLPALRWPLVERRLSDDANEPAARTPSSELGQGAPASGLRLEGAVGAFAQAPFRPSEGALGRAALIETRAGGERYLVLVVHPAVADSVSIGILWAEWATLYVAEVSARDAPPLSWPAAQWSDFWRARSELMTTPQARACAAFWRAQVQGVALPSSAWSQEGSSQRGCDLRLELMPSLYKRLTGLAEALDVTPFMVLLTAYCAQLHLESGLSALLVSTPVARRGAARLASLVGALEGNLLLRVECGRGSSVRELLQQVQSGTVAAYQNQSVTPDDALGQDADPSIMTTRFVLEEEPEVFEVAQARCVPVELPLEPAQGISLRVFRREGGLRLRLQCGSDWGPARAARFLRSYEELLWRLEEGLDTPLETLPPSASRLRQMDSPASSQDMPRSRPLPTPELHQEVVASLSHAVDPSKWSASALAPLPGGSSRPVPSSQEAELGAAPPAVEEACRAEGPLASRCQGESLPLEAPSTPARDSRRPAPTLAPPTEPMPTEPMAEGKPAPTLAPLTEPMKEGGPAPTSAPPADSFRKAHRGGNPRSRRGPAACDSDADELGDSGLPRPSAEALWGPLDVEPGSELLPLSRPEVARPLPLSATQHRRFARRNEGAAVRLMRVTLAEDWDERCLAQALAALGERRDALRLRFEREARRQLLAPLSLPHWEFRRLRRGPSPDWQSLEAEVCEGCGVGSGPLARAALVQAPSGHRDALILALHEWVADEPSTRLLLDDLFALYEGLASGRSPELAPAGSFADWLEARLGLPAALSAQLDYWCSQPWARAQRHWLAAASAGEQAHGAQAALSVDLTARLLAREDPGARLLSGFIFALCRCLRLRAVGVDLEADGRKGGLARSLPPGSTAAGRVLGPCSVHYPLFVQLGAGHEPLPPVRAALSSVPHGGASFGELRYRSAHASRMQEFPYPKAAFRLDDLRPLSTRSGVLGQLAAGPRPVRGPSLVEPLGVLLFATVDSERVTLQWAVGEAMAGAAEPQALHQALELGLQRQLADD